MNKIFMVTNTLFAVICASLIQNASYAEPVNLSKFKSEIKQYHDSGLYQKELTQVIKQADLYISKKAHANQHAIHKQKLAIVLDIDETSLSNYDYFVDHDFGYDRKSFAAYKALAKTPPIKPMLALYQNAQKNGVAVFFVTGRVPSERQATEKNLIKAGYSKWTTLYLRPAHDHQTSAIPFKSKTRATITKQGYVVIASIGDQYSDLKGGYAERTFKLPNPYYFLP